MGNGGHDSVMRGGDRVPTGVTVRASMTPSHGVDRSLVLRIRPHKFTLPVDYIFMAIFESVGTVFAAVAFPSVM
jgi:hypothetical protein